MENRIPKVEKRPSMLGRRLTAMVCTIAVWFSFIIGSTVQAAQNEMAFSAAPTLSETASGVQQYSGIADSLLGTNSGITIIATTLFTVAIISYSLFTSGKRGWGWSMICVSAGIILIFARFGISLFNEIASPNSVQDWDN